MPVLYTVHGERTPAIVRDVVALCVPFQTVPGDMVIVVEYCVDGGSWLDCSLYGCSSVRVLRTKRQKNSNTLGRDHGRKHILVDTLNNAANPTRCRRPLNPVRLCNGVLYCSVSTARIFYRPHCARRAGPGHLWSHPGGYVGLNPNHCLSPVALSRPARCRRLRSA